MGAGWEGITGFLQDLGKASQKSDTGADLRNGADVYPKGKYNALVTCCLKKCISKIGRALLMNNTGQ